MTDHTPTPRVKLIREIRRRVGSYGCADWKLLDKAANEITALERELAEANKKINANALAAVQVAEERDEARCALANEQTRCHMLDQEHARWKFRAVEAEESLRGASAVAEGVVRVAVGLGLYDGTSPIKGDKIFDLVLAMKTEIEDGKLALGTMHRLFAEKDKALCANAAYAEELRAALKPFAHDDLCRQLGGNEQGDASPVFQRITAWLTLGDFRRARAALAKNPNPSGHESPEPSGSLSPEDSGPVGLGPLARKALGIETTVTGAPDDALTAYKLVPLEPTAEMLKACDTVIQGYGAKLVWKRMVAAAPVVARVEPRQQDHGALQAEVVRHRKRWTALESMLRLSPGCVIADLPAGVRIVFAHGQMADADDLPSAVDAASKWPPLPVVSSEEERHDRCGYLADSNRLRCSLTAGHGGEHAYVAWNKGRRAQLGAVVSPEENKQLSSEATPAMVEAVSTILQPYAAKLVWKRMLEVACAEPRHAASCLSWRKLPCNCRDEPPKEKR